MFYLLDERGQPVLSSFEETAHLFGAADTQRRVAWTERGGVAVSTVFLVIDHNHGRGAPILWETMVERDGGWEEQDRYCTLKEAIEGHKAMVAEVFGEDAPKTEWGSLVVRADEGPLRVLGPSAWQRLLGPELDFGV